MLLLFFSCWLFPSEGGQSQSYASKQHLSLFSGTSSLTSSVFMFSFTTSLNILWSSSRSPACQVQPHFQPRHLTFYVLQLYSFLILSNLVTKEKLKDLICTTSCFASCLFISATVSEPDSIAALTNVFFPFIRADTLPSHTTPDISPHPSQPASTLFFPSFSHLWLLCLVLKISHLPFHCSMSPHPSTCSSLKLNFALGC